MRRMSKKSASTAKASSPSERASCSYAYVQTASRFATFRRRSKPRTNALMSALVRPPLSGNVSSIERHISDSMLGRPARPCILLASGELLPLDLAIHDDLTQSVECHAQLIDAEGAPNL
eukprot:scaffold103793_cov65-Phaeocystis_antarctica.AAC.5